jgi:hypothetical protein
MINNYFNKNFNLIFYKKILKFKEHIHIYLIPNELYRDLNLKPLCIRSVFLPFIPNELSKSN